MENYGFIYIWFDRRNKMYYIGSHWGSEYDGYICSSVKMLRAFEKRKNDFKRRIIKYIYTNRKDLLNEEDRWLKMIDPSKTIKYNTSLRDREKNVRYYNINLKTWEVWHNLEESRKTVGQKISHSKTGKSVPASPDNGAKISAAKKGKPLTEEHKVALKGIKKKPHTDEWKQQNSERMKQQWSDGTRKKAEPKITMPREEQDKLCSQQLKNRWSDPIWAEHQRNKLKESWAKRKQNINKQKEQVKLVN